MKATRESVMHAVVHLLSGPLLATVNIEHYVIVCSCIVPHDEEVKIVEPPKRPLTVIPPLVGEPARVKSLHARDDDHKADHKRSRRISPDRLLPASPPIVPESDSDRKTRELCTAIYNCTRSPSLLSTPISSPPSSSSSLSSPSSIGQGQASAPAHSAEDQLAHINRLITPTVVLNAECKSVHPLGWAVIADRADIVALLLDRGADIDHRTVKGHTAIYLAITQLYDGSEMVRYLLSRGAKYEAKDVLPPNTVFTSPVITDKLTESMKYWLKRAGELPISERRQDVLKKLDCIGLRQLSFGLVGQRLASSLLTESTILFRADRSTKVKPLVLLFAGPPGHGKTVLAQRYGEAIVPGRNNYVKVDCANIHTEQDLFGSGRGYMDSGKGSELNNFLSEREGKACIVLLDEFEHMSVGARQGLLNPFEKGEWHEKRPDQSHTLSCSNTIFILTTNVLDAAIIDFFRTRPPAVLSMVDVDRKIEMELDAVLRPLLRNRFGDAFARRIDNIIPFIPFNSEEQKVLADQTLREVCGRFRSPPDPEKKKYVGNITVKFTADVRDRVASKYSASAGASSIHQAVGVSIERPVVMLWVDKGHFISRDEAYTLIVPAGSPDAPITLIPQAAFVDVAHQRDTSGSPDPDIPEHNPPNDTPVPSLQLPMLEL
jgi:DNA polymerase III delta prime subunit